MLIITAPGQGAQSPGFLAPWLDIPGVAERLGAASELAGLDLIRFGTTGTADEIRDTAVAQPLLVAAALAVAAGLAGGEPSDIRADAAAGHSVGELAAGVLAGVLGTDDAMRLVSVRGKAMAAASAVEPTGMTAVLGGDEDTVLAAIGRHGGHHVPGVEGARDLQRPGPGPGRRIGRECLEAGQRPGGHDLPGPVDVGRGQAVAADGR